MEKEFVPYAQALELKELGFDEPCFGFYSKIYGLMMVKTSGSSSLYKDAGECLSPTFSQAFRWFRDEHKLLHELVSVQENSWLISIVDMNSKSVNGVYMKSVNLDDIDENIPETYEEAELECLKKLIQIVKEKL